MIHYNSSVKQFHKEVSESYQFVLKFLTLPKDIVSYISLPLSPYLSFLISEFINIDKIFLEIINQDLAFKRRVGISRNYWKFWTDQSITKTKRTIEDSVFFMENILQEDYNFFQKMFVKLFKQDNFGVFYYNGYPIFNTVQGQEINNAIVSLKKNRLPKKNESIEFGSSLTSTLVIIKTLFDEMFGKFNLSEDKNNEIDFNNFEYQDFYLSVEELDVDDFTLVKEIVMLNIFCNINYLQEIAPNYMSKSNDFYFRIRLISYISSCEMLRKLTNKKEVMMSDLEINNIKELLNTKEKIISTNLRNNIFHYLIDVPDNSNPTNLKEVFSLSSSINIKDIDEFIESEFEKIKLICDTGKFSINKFI